MVDSQARILVVDDDPKMIHLVKEVLDMIPCETLVAVEGEGALALLHRELDKGTPVDAVLLDVMMPGEDGFRILERMKADAQLGQTPVILITGLDSIPSKTRGLQMGADDYVIKPFDPQELMARVGVVLRIRRTEQMLRRRNQELAALDDINRMVSSSLDLDEVLASALEGLGRLIETDALALVLNDEESQAWVIRTARAHSEVWLEGRVVPADDAILRGVVIDSRSMLFRGVREGFWIEALSRAPLDILCVPLTKGSERIGALVVLK